MTCQCWTAETVVEDETVKLQAVKEEKNGSNGQVHCQRAGEGISQTYWRDTRDRTQDGLKDAACLAMPSNPVHLIQVWKRSLLWIAGICSVWSLGKTAHSTGKSSTWHGHVTKEYRNHYRDQQASERVPKYHTWLLDALLRLRNKCQISEDEQQML